MDGEFKSAMIVKDGLIAGSVNSLSCMLLKYKGSDVELIEFLCNCHCLIYKVKI
jgi:hypothetical protein